MLKKVIFFSLLFIGILSAATEVNLNKATYTPNENIIVNFSNMTAKNQDWIGIYPKDANNTFDNCVAWKWTNDVSNGTLTFTEALPTGEYEARAFYNNSVHLEAKQAFTIQENVVAPVVTTSKAIYAPQENITVHFSNMTAKNQDWIGIYPKDANNTFDNCVAWKWTNDVSNGTLTFTKYLPAGEYEARAFYNNSVHLEAKKAFTIQGSVVPPTVTTNKTSYAPNENIIVNFSNMAAKNQDWIGIYPKDANNTFDNCVAWKWTNDVGNGTLTFTKKLPVGEYEARAFYNNSVHLEAKKAFTIIDNTPNRIIYETAENGFNPLWQRRAGNYEPQILDGGAQGSQHALRVRADWRKDEGGGSYYNHAFYLLDLENPASKLKYLELDVRAGISSHIGYFGLILETTQGYRWMTWSSWMNHSNGHGGNDMSGNATPLPPMKYTTESGLVLLMFPGPTDYYLLPQRNHQRFEHYKIDIEAQLKRLEPDNKLLRIKYFITTGVDLDNLALDAQL